MLKRFPFALLSLAIFSIQALLAQNITGVSPRIASPPLVISLDATLILVLLIILITRNWQKAAITTSLTSSLA